jgi:hypothetical protein
MILGELVSSVTLSFKITVFWAMTPCNLVEKLIKFSGRNRGVAITQTNGFYCSIHNMFRPYRASSGDHQLRIPQDHLVMAYTG